MSHYLLVTIMLKLKVGDSRTLTIRNHLGSALLGWLLRVFCICIFICILSRSQFLVKNTFILFIKLYNLNLCYHKPLLINTILIIYVYRYSYINFLEMSYNPRKALCSVKEKIVCLYVCLYLASLFPPDFYIIWKHAL